MTDDGRIDPSLLTPEAREVLPYVPEGMSVVPDSIRGSLRAIRINDQIGEGAIGFSVMGLAGWSVGILPAFVASHVLGLDGHAGEIATLTAPIPLGLWVGAAYLKSMAVGTYNATLTRIRRRIVDITSSCADDDSMNGLKRARTLAEGHHGAPAGDVVTLMRIDAVAVALDDAIRAAGPDGRAAAKARRTAENAVSAIMSTTETFPSDGASRRAAIRLEETCASLTRGTVPLLAAPSPRIGRVLSLAEKALATHPDIVDAAGGRIDHLVRIHVPRLVALRTEALETARSQDVEKVDRGFDAAFDGIVASIEEAIASIHDETMDRLATEMRFLTARRGETPLITAM